MEVRQYGVPQSQISSTKLGNNVDPKEDVIL